MAKRTSLVKIFALLIILACGLFTGCVSMIMKSSLANTTAANRIMLHTNPQIGDYSLVESIGISEAALNPETRVVSKTEIVGKEGDLFIVTLTYVDATVKSIMDFGFEYYVDETGTVKKALMLDFSGSAVKKTPINVARPGEPSYVEFSDLSQTVTVKNATKRFTNVKIFKSETFTGDANNNFKTESAYYLSDALPFQILFGEVLGNGQHISTSVGVIGSRQTTMYSRQRTSLSMVMNLIETGNSVKKTSEKYDTKYEIVE